MRGPVWVILALLITVSAVVPAFAQRPPRLSTAPAVSVTHTSGLDRAKKKRKHRAKKHRRKTTHATHPTATPTVVPTQTPTPSPTSTPTPTATPAPAELTESVLSSAPVGYSVAHVACGNLQGMSARFSPNPAGSSFDANLNGQPAAVSVLDITVPWSVPSGQYALAIRSFFHDPSGQNVTYPPSGGETAPRGVLVTVTGAGRATLSPLTTAPVTDSPTCTPLPGGFGPPDAPSPTAGPILPYAYVADPAPPQNGRETVYGGLQQDGHYLQGVQMHANWFFPYGIQSCDGVSTTTGTAFCSLGVGPVPHYYTVQVQVTLSYHGAQFVAYTYFVVA
ncbi:MAG: hypothetical protein NVS2B16_33640 [Chloroflexota bacterium]